MSTDDKYVTFKRDDLYEALKGQPISVAALEIKDAVVIRRQDFFASPALAGYAASIAIAIQLTDDPKRAQQLRYVADYFERQSELAADEGWKLPDV
jgi:hypothetical protein